MLINKGYSYFLPIKVDPLNLNQANNIPVVHGSSVKGFMSYDQRYNQTKKDYYSIYTNKYNPSFQNHNFTRPEVVKIDFSSLFDVLHLVLLILQLILHNLQPYPRKGLKRLFYIFQETAF